MGAVGADHRQGSEPAEPGEVSEVMFASSINRCGPAVRPRRLSAEAMFHGSLRGSTKAPGNTAASVALRG